MPRIPPTPPLFDQMFLSIGGQGLDLFLLPGGTLVSVAAQFILPQDRKAAVAFLDKLLDGRMTAVEIKSWVNKRCRDIYFRNAADIAGTLRGLRDILAPGRRARFDGVTDDKVRPQKCQAAPAQFRAAAG